MKQKTWKCVLMIPVLAVLTLCILCGCADTENGKNSKTPEPLGSGTANKNYDTEVSELTQPVFSDRGGFYGNRMALTISVPEIYRQEAAYLKITYDGSEPTASSQNYDGSEIILPDASHTDTDFFDEDANFSVTVIRAACFDKKNKMLGQIATATYIKLPSKDGNIDTGRFTTPVISLVTDDANLSDPSIGIFENAGQKGADWERPVHISFFEADGKLGFSQDAGIRLFGGSSRGLAQKSLRITARKEQYFDSETYDGGGKFRYPLFPDRKKSNGEVLAAYDSIVLRNGGNDSFFTQEDGGRATMMRDGLAALIAQKAAPEVDAMAYRPVVVFLNGEYYGLMNLREYENNKYIQNVYDIEDKEGVAVISSELNTANGARYDGTWFYYKQTDGQYGELREFSSLLEDIVFGGKYTYDEAARQIDLDNFMKYCAINLFVCNTDWPHNNIRVWRYTGYAPGENADASVTDGRWRFMIKDADLGLGRYVCGTNAEYPIELYTKADCKNIRLMLCGYLNFADQSGYPDVTEHFYPDSLYIQGLFYFCMKNEGFASRFYEYCNTLATEIWTPEALEALFAQCADAVQKEIAYTLNKSFGKWQWHATTDFVGWNGAVHNSGDSLISWARERSGANGEFLKQVAELRETLS